MPEHVQAHRDEMAQGLQAETGKVWEFQFGEPQGEIHVRVKDQNLQNPVPQKQYTIQGPHGVSLSGTTGDQGEIDHPGPYPIDHYTLHVCDQDFPIESRLAGLDPIPVRVPGFPPAEPPPPSPNPHEPGADCSLQNLTDPPQWMIDKPARDLTKNDAMHLFGWFAKQGWVDAQGVYGQHYRFHHLQQGVCTLAAPGPHAIAMRSTIDSVEWKYVNHYRPGGIISLSPLHNLDVRNLVMIVRLTRLLKQRWGATQIYHLGIGSGGGPQDDCHNQGRAIDFVGGHGTCPADHPVQALRGYEWDLVCQLHWGNVHAGDRGTYRLDAFANETDQAKLAACYFYKDVWNFCFAQAAYMSMVGCHYDAQTGAPRGDDRDAAGPADIAAHGGCILYPDVPSSYAAQHQNHYHFQVGPTRPQYGPGYDC